MDQNFFDDNFIADPRENPSDMFSLPGTAAPDQSESYPALELDIESRSSSVYLSQANLSTGALGCLQDASQFEEQMTEVTDVTDGYVGMPISWTSPQHGLELGEEQVVDSSENVDETEDHTMDAPVTDSDFIMSSTLDAPPTNFDFNISSASPLTVHDFNMTSDINDLPSNVDFNMNSTSDNFLTDFDFDFNMSSVTNAPLANLEFNTSAMNATFDVFDSDMSSFYDATGSSFPDMSRNDFTQVCPAIDVNESFDIPQPSFNQAPIQPDNQLVLLQPSQYPTTSTPSLHGPAMSKPKSRRKNQRNSYAKKQVHAFQQRVSKISKHGGIPPALLGGFCMEITQPEKRSRTQPEIEKRKEIEAKGGSCTLCQILHKSCSGERPCKSCIDWWGKMRKTWEDDCKKYRAMSYSSTDFQWTCDISTKLCDLIPIPKAGLDVGMSIEKLLKHDWRKTASELEAIRGLYESLVNILDTIDPDFMELLHYVFDGRDSITNIGTALYSSKASHWISVLSYLIPEHNDLLQESVHLSCRMHWKKIKLVDGNHLSIPQRGFVVFHILLLLEDVRRMKREWSRPLIEQVEKVLRGKLEILCARDFDIDIEAFPSLLQAPFMTINWIALDSANKTRCYLPPRFRNVSSNLWEIYMRQIWPELAVPPRNSVSCLYSRNQEFDEAGEENCCCGWVFDSIPARMLTFFAHSRESFADYVHGWNWVIDLSDHCSGPITKEGGSPGCQTPHVKQVPLKKFLTILRYTLWLTINQTFLAIRIAIMHFDMTPKLPQGHPGCPEGHPEAFRRLLLLIIVDEAVNTFCQFFASCKSAEDPHAKFFASGKLLALSYPCPIPTVIALQHIWKNLEVKGGTWEDAYDLLQKAKAVNIQHDAPR